MSSSAPCNCDQSRANPFYLPSDTGHPTRDHIGATPGISEKLDRLRAEAERQARDFAKHGMAFESLEWEAAAKWLRCVK